eukprot:1859973-Amphidinium_carterae.1
MVNHRSDSSNSRFGQTNLPHVSGGGRTTIKTSLANTQPHEPSLNLQLHEDEFTYTEEVPKIGSDATCGSVITVNVTSLKQHWEAVIALNADIMCLTEVRLDLEQQRIMSSRMAAAGYDVTWGSPSPTRVNKRGTPYLAWGGVALVAKNHWTLVPTPIEGEDIERLHQEGRFIAAEVVGPKGTQRIQIHVLYVTATALEYAVAHGWFQRNAILAGDFNLEVDQAPL